MTQAAEDKVYGLIVQAQEMQRFALEFKGTAEGVLKILPDACRNAVRDAAREFITEGAENANKSLLDASKEAIAAAGAIRSAQSWALVKHIAILFGIALLLAAALYGVKRSSYFSKEKAWELELGENAKERWVIFPKGTTIIQTFQTQDGRSTVILSK